MSQGPPLNASQSPIQMIQPTQSLNQVFQQMTMQHEPKPHGGNIIMNQRESEEMVADFDTRSQPLQ